MCGITAILKLDDNRVDLPQLRGMCSAVAHRGPDGASYALLAGGRLALGNVRLSINDLAGGSQPFYNEDYSVAAVCNGELYDYREQRRELRQRGHVLRTMSDCELIVHLYEEHGVDCVRHVNGEFAFVLWDERRQRLLAARDRAGVKPLCYYQSARELLISSEVKGILSVPGAPRRISNEYLMSTGLGVVTDGATAFEEVRALRPGHRLIVQHDRVLDEAPYHAWSFATQPKIDFDKATERVREAVTVAVKRRLVADVPVHCYLSGGVDSAIICGLMADSVSRFTAYHVAFADAAYDESAQAEAIARHFGQTLETVRCTGQILGENLVETVEHVEAPLPNSNAVGKFLLSKLVRSQGNKVCLTGEGADEVFGGYAYFMLEALWRSALQGRLSGRRHRALWSEFQRIHARSRGVLWHNSGRWREGGTPYSFPSYLHISAIENGTIGPWLFQTKMRRDALEQRFLSAFPPADLAMLHPFNATRRMAFQILAGVIIPSLGDRVEMAHAVECRTPYLDADLLSLATELPPEHFLDVNELREKRVLHAAFRHLLPVAVQRRHKHPFIAPRWRSVLSTPIGRELLAEFLSPARARRAGIYRPRVVGAIRRLWQLGSTHWQFVRRLDPLIGILLTTHILHDRFVDNRIERDDGFSMTDRSPARLAIDATKS
jgi:asparagine synthase (glutamine-hydrolysing)